MFTSYSFGRLSSLFFAFEWQNKENEIRGRKKVLSYLLCMRASRGWIYSWCIFLKYIHSIRNNHTRNFCRYFFYIFLSFGILKCSLRFYLKRNHCTAYCFAYVLKLKEALRPVFSSFASVVFVIATRSKSIICSSYLLNRNKKNLSLFL